MNMAVRKPLVRNNHLEEAMVLLIRNQAAFVDQVARNNQEWLEVKQWQAKAELRFEEIERRLERIEASLIELPKIILKTVLEQLPKAVKKEIGFAPPGQ